MKNKVEYTESGSMMGNPIITNGTYYYLIDTNTMSDWNGEFHTATPCDKDGNVIPGSTIEAWPVQEMDEDGNCVEVLGYSSSRPY